MLDEQLVTTHKTIHRIFPTVVLKKTLELPQPLIDESVSFIKHFAKDRDLSSNRRVTADRAKQTLHLEPGIASLMQPVFREVAEFLYDVLNFARDKTTFYVGRSWPVIQISEGEGSLHFHAGSVFSGVFFLQAPEGSGGLEFIRPHGTAADNLYKSRFTELTTPSVAFKVGPQQLWLFNGELWHRALPSAAGMEEPRIAFAFDIYTTTDISNRSGGMPHAGCLRSLEQLEGGGLAGAG